MNTSKVLLFLITILILSMSTTSLSFSETDDNNPYLINLTKNHNLVVEKTFNDFTTSWYHKPGLTKQEYIIPIQNHITENRYTNISMLISETGFDIDKVSNIEFTEYKPVPYNYTINHYDYINHSEWNATNQTWNNWTEQVLNYTETIESEKLDWKACKMKTFSQSGKEIKEGYGDILIPLFGSKDKGTGTYNGTKIFRLIFDTPITDMGDGWGSNGRVALYLDEDLHCPPWNVSYDIRLKMPINNTAGAGQLTDFQVNTNLSTYSANASSLRCYNRSTGSIMAHWNESVVGGNVYELWTNNSLIASGWDNNTFCSWQTTPTTSSSSSITDTMVLGDEFLGSSIDAGKWTESGSVTVADSIVTMGGTNNVNDKITSISTFSVNTYVLEYRGSLSNTVTVRGGFWLDSPRDVAEFYTAYTSDGYWTDTRNDGSGTLFGLGNGYTGYHIWKIIPRTSDVLYYIDGVLKKTETNNVPNSAMIIEFVGYESTGTVALDWAIVYKYNATPPVYESFELEYYIPSLYYNTTPVLNTIYSSPHEYALNLTATGKTNTNDTAKSTGLSEAVITNYNNSVSIVRNFTLTGDDLDWYQAANLSGSYSMKNSTGTVQTVSDGNFTVNLVTGDYWIESEVAAPIITLLSQTPSTICQNCTGNISIEYGISHSSAGLNNTSISFIYRDYDHDLSDSNHSTRPPANDLASEWNYDGRILRGANRNESLNFENNATITGGDIYSWSGLDENNSEMSIVYVNSSYTKVYINSTIHRVMPQMHYIDRLELQEAPKTTISIHKNQDVLVKFWNFEIFKGNTDFLGVGYTDTSLSSNPALHPSDANPVNYYYISSGYDPSTGGDPLTSGYAVFMGSLNSTGWVNHVYSPHTNSSYTRGFINNTLLHSYINTTNISYVLYTSNTPPNKAFLINVTDVATSSNVSFANTSVLWAGDNAMSVEPYTPNIWFAFMKNNVSFDHKLFVADNNDLWGNSTINSTTVGEALFPPTKPSFYSFHNGVTDYDMNGSYSGIFNVQISAGSDPDGGDVVHNVSLYYGNGTYIQSIFNTSCNASCLYMNVSFDSTPYYSDTENYTFKVVATDDEGESITTWLGVNFTLDSTISFSNGAVSPVTVLQGHISTVSIDVNDTVGTVNSVIVKIRNVNYSMSLSSGDTWTYAYSGSFVGKHYVTNFYATDDTSDTNSTTSSLYINVLDSSGSGGNGPAPTATPTATPTPTPTPTIEVPKVNITVPHIFDIIAGKGPSMFKLNFGTDDPIYSKNMTYIGIKSCKVIDGDLLANCDVVDNQVRVDVQPSLKSFYNYHVGHVQLTDEDNTIHDIPVEVVVLDAMCWVDVPRTQIDGLPSVMFEKEPMTGDVIGVRLWWIFGLLGLGLYKFGRDKRKKAA